MSALLHTGCASKYRHLHRCSLKVTYKELLFSALTPPSSVFGSNSSCKSASCTIAVLILVLVIVVAVPGCLATAASSERQPPLSQQHAGLLRSAAP
eukprot:7285-Heterococcus_DN1.PRE.1